LWQVPDGTGSRPSGRFYWPVAGTEFVHATALGGPSGAEALFRIPGGDGWQFEARRLRFVSATEAAVVLSETVTEVRPPVYHVAAIDGASISPVMRFDQLTDDGADSGNNYVETARVAPGRDRVI